MARRPLALWFASAAAVIAVAAAPAPAAADTEVEAFGTATIGAADPAAARTRALDDAFRQAVDQTVVSLLDPAVREKNADLIKKRILRRSRTYVSKFKVRTEGEDNGVYNVHLDATIAVETITADLRTLKIPLLATTEPEPEPKPNPDVITRPVGSNSPVRPRILLLVAEGEGESMRATFGRTAQPGPAAEALQRALESRGFQVLQAAGLDIPVQAADSAPPAAGLPLTDEQGSVLARQVGAGAMLIGGVRARDGGRIRGTQLAGAEADLAYRALELTANAPLGLVSDQATDAAAGTDLAAASAAAARAVGESAGRSLAARLAARWPDVSNGPGLPVRIRGVTRWPDVNELIKAATAIPGVKSVVAAGFARDQISLAVIGSATAKGIAAALDAATITGLEVSAKVTSGDPGVTVQVRPAAVAPPPQQ